MKYRQVTTVDCLAVHPVRHLKIMIKY